MKAFTIPMINACCHLSISLEEFSSAKWGSVLHLWQHQQWFVIKYYGIGTEEELSTKQLWLIT